MDTKAILIGVTSGALAFAAVSWGCIPMGDALVEIRGVLPSNATTVLICELTLASDKRELHSSKISGDFHVNYTIEPRRRNYYVSISCEGNGQTILVVDEKLVELGGQSITVVDLGLLLAHQPNR